MSLADYITANRAVWNAWTERDLASDHHQNVARFQAGQSTLRGIERDELGEVAGKTLLHLECNMGSDTLSWARLGASVTGVDISDAAIEQARALAAATELPARFIRSDLYDLPAHLDDQFDVVFTSYGALCWLADLPRWAEIVARYVRPGGIFYIVDMHPFTQILRSVPADPADTDAAAPTFRVAAPYFHTATPIAEEVHLAGPDSSTATLYGWTYGLGEVLTVLIAAGLRPAYLHEFPYAHYQRFPSLVRDANGWWRWPDPANTLPLLFSIKASA